MLQTQATAWLAIGTGVALEVGIHALSGRREAWDSGLYWTVGLPLAALVAFALGRCARGRDWRWTFAIVPSQVFTMMLRSGELGGLWPLAVGLSALLSTPFVLAAWIGSRSRPAGGPST